MTKAIKSGTKGEKDVVRLVSCPNCRSDLMLLPPINPLFDVQCTRCMFRAQVKTNQCKPKSEIFGAGWQILDKTLKAGQFVPPLIVNFTWTGPGTVRRREIYFFPFLTRENLRKRTRSMDGKRPGYQEFNYIDLFGEHTPRKLLYSDGA